MKKKKVLALLLISTLLFSGCNKVKEKEEVDFQDGEKTSIEEVVEETEQFSEEQESEEAKTEEDSFSFESEEELFMGFLEGKVQAHVASDFENSLAYACTIYNVGADDSYEFGLAQDFTMDELMECVKNSDLYEVNPVASYYIARTAKDKAVLMLKVEGLNIYCEGDDSYAIFIFAEDNGELKLNFADDSWARSALIIYDDLTFVNYGSNGAGDSSTDCFSLDDNGKVQFEYSMWYLFADWIGMNLTEDLYNDAGFDEEDEVDILTTADAIYYSAPNLAGNEQKYAAVTEALASKGAKLVDDASSMIEEPQGKMIEDWVALK